MEKLYSGVIVNCSKEDLYSSCVIYKLVIGDKIYIGQTTQALKDRLKRHCYDAFNIKNSQYSNHKSRSIRKYKKIYAEVVKTCSSVDEMNAAETAEIEKCKAMDRTHGLNLESGGKNGKRMNDATRKIISEKMLKNPIREKEVEIYCTKTNKLIKVFRNMATAARHYNVSESSIQKVANPNFKNFKTFLKGKYTAKHKTKNMKIKLDSIDNVELFIEKANLLLGYPDQSGTETYCNVPEITEIKNEDSEVIDSYYLIPITGELNNKMIEIATKQLIQHEEV